MTYYYIVFNQQDISKWTFLQNHKLQDLSTEVYETVLDLYESGEGFEFGIMNDLYYQLFHGYEDPFDS